jgi:hypothetical protein
VFGWAPDLRSSQIRTYERVMRGYGDVVGLAVGPPGARFDLYCVFHPDGLKPFWPALARATRRATGSTNRSRRPTAGGC